MHLSCLSMQMTVNKYGLFFWKVSWILCCLLFIRLYREVYRVTQVWFGQLAKQLRWLVGHTKSGNLDKVLIAKHISLLWFQFYVYIFSKEIFPPKQQKNGRPAWHLMI